MVDSKRETETDALPRIFSPLVRNKPPFPTILNTAADNYTADYDMDYPNRGTAMIFNNKLVNPSGIPPVNHGFDVDCERLKETLVLMGFEKRNIKVFNELDRYEMEMKLREAAAEDHSQSDCMFIAILIRGQNDFLRGDEKEELWNPLISDSCPTLAGKPKIIFVQVCDVRVVKFDTSTGDTVDFKYSTPGQRIPSHADFFIAYATVSDKDPWFIQCFCDIFDEHGQTEDIATLLTRVNQQIAIDIESNSSNPRTKLEKKIPRIMSMLTRRVYFKPKQIEMKMEIDTQNDDVIVEAETSL